MLQLRAGPAEALIDETGGRVASLRLDRAELLLTEADSPVDRGLYPMVPFAGRIRHGRFTFDGVDHQLPCNLGPHAIHGTVLATRWRTVDHAADRWCGSVDLGPPWPFGGTATHELRLRPDGLTARLEVTNDDRAMPVTAGWHPWWRRRLGTGDLELDVDLTAARMYERGDDHVPTGRLIAPSAPPWDDCFTHLRRPPILRWPCGLTITTATTADHWVLFTRPDQALCVEPQSGPPDAVNLGTGCTLVAPGRPLILEASWTWRSDAQA